MEKKNILPYKGNKQIKTTKHLFIMKQANLTPVKVVSKAALVFSVAVFFISCKSKQNCPAYSGAYKYKGKHAITQVFKDNFFKA